MYWQAYQMDSGFKNKIIAKSCSKSEDIASKVGPVTGGRCNLRQFLYHISGNEADKAIIADKNKLKDEDLKDETKVDHLATKLHEAGVGGTYNPGHIYQNLDSRTSIDKLITTIAG